MHPLKGFIEMVRRKPRKTAVLSGVHHPDIDATMGFVHFGWVVGFSNGKFDPSGCVCAQQVSIDVVRQGQGFDVTITGEATKCDLICA